MTSISEMKKAAKTQLDGKWLMTAGVLLVGTLILSAVTFTVVGLLLLLGVIEFGVCAFMLTLTRNKIPNSASCCRASTASATHALREF